MKKKIYLIIILIISLIIVIALTEIYLRYVGLGDPIAYDRNYVYGYAPKQDQKKVRLHNSTVTINDVGLRSVMDWQDKQDYKKIIFYGDSVTYGGSYIDDRETFVYLSCEKFDKLKVLCGNAGVNSYGIHNIIYRSKFDERIKNVYLKVFIIVPDDFYRGLQNSNTAHFYLNEKRFFLPAIFEALSFFATKYDLNNYISKMDDTKINDNKIDLINETIKFIKLEFKELEAKNQKYLAFYIHPRENSDISQYIFNSLNKDIDIIDTSYLLNRNSYVDGIHLNKSGHKIISNLIYKNLNRVLKSN